MKAAFKIDRREFDRSLRKYVEYSRRDHAVIVNTKAYYIARSATVHTPKADKARVLAELRGSRLKNVTTKSGKTKQIKYTLAQLLVVAQRAAKGLSTKKKDIASAVKMFIASRLRSISFLKAGWIPAIKILEPLADRISGAPARLNKSNSGVQYGKAKGTARPASPNSGFKALATITNNALPNSKAGNFIDKIIHHMNPPNRAQALSYAEPALQKAFDDETKSNDDYVEKKLKASAARAGIKTR